MTGARRYTAEDMELMGNNFAYPMKLPVIAEMLRQAAKTEAELESERDLRRGAYDGLLQANCKVERLEADVQGLVNRLELVAKGWEDTANATGKDAYTFGRMQVATVVIEEIREALSKFRGES